MKTGIEQQDLLNNLKKKVPPSDTRSISDSHTHTDTNTHKRTTKTAGQPDVLLATNIVSPTSMAKAKPGLRTASKTNETH